MIQVWHDKKPTFGRTTREFNEENFEKVAEVLTDSLEGAFLQTNSIETPWNGNYRSTSVGDVLMHKRVAYLITSTGYAELYCGELNPCGKSECPICYKACMEEMEATATPLSDEELECVMEEHYQFFRKKQAKDMQGTERKGAR